MISLSFKNFSRHLLAKLDESRSNGQFGQAEIELLRKKLSVVVSAFSAERQKIENELNAVRLRCRRVCPSSSYPTPLSSFTIRPTSEHRSSSEPSASWISLFSWIFSAIFPSWCPMLPHKAHRLREFRLCSQPLTSQPSPPRNSTDGTRIQLRSCRTGLQLVLRRSWNWRMLAVKLKYSRCSAALCRRHGNGTHRI